MRRLLGLLPLAALSAYASACSSDAGPAAPAPVDYELIDELAQAPKSSSLSCPATGAEDRAPYACPAMKPWRELPHSEDCPAWDGASLPSVASLTGRCTSSLPSAEARKFTGDDPDRPGGFILPDGHRIDPAGAYSVLRSDELTKGATTTVRPVPGTKWALTVDAGQGAHVVRAIDTTRIGAGDPTVSFVKWPQSATLGGSVAVRGARAYVATNTGTLDALDLDLATGTLTRNAAKALRMPAQPIRSASAEWYVSDVTFVAGGTKLLATSIQQDEVVLFDVDDASPTYGQVVGRADLGEHEHGAAVVPPGADATRFVYVPVSLANAVVEVELTNDGPVKRRSFPTAANPLALAFLNERFFAVANAYGDSLTVVDRVSGASREVLLETTGERVGTEPTSVAFDAAARRLYVAEAGISRVQAFDVTFGAGPADAPTLTPAGRIDTLWWPSHVALLEDGRLLVSSLRGLGIRGSNKVIRLEEDAVYDRLAGGVQRVDDTSAAAFAQGQARFRRERDLSAWPGAPAVTCPTGAAMDFPLPPTNTDGPSKRIDRVVIVLRENKTFDGIFGDMPGVEGNPAQTLKASKDDQELIWKNLRNLARTFSHSDNYYTSAEISTLGHVWATYGRSNDFNERYWPVAGYGHSARAGDLDIGGIAKRGRPTEGSLFSWLSRNQIPYDIFGEAVGMPASGGKTDQRYPGGFIQSMGHPDVEKSCHVAGRLRLRCDVGNVTFMTLSNDHTSGIGANTASPETHIAVNDEATGMMADALSHSPDWPRTLYVVIEDDPANGGDHIDQHRTPFVLVSPWVKRGYVSRTHLDVSSIHKMIAHLFGKPYPSRVVAEAALPLDMFSNVPDFTPYTYAPRQWKQACGAETTDAERSLSAMWIAPRMDADARFDDQIRRHLRGRPLPKLTPSLARDLEDHLSARAAERLPKLRVEIDGDGDDD
jgi:hypothetical protein